MADSNPPPLCSACQNSITGGSFERLAHDDLNDDDPWEPHHDSWQSLVDAASSGCPLCKALLRHRSPQGGKGFARSVIRLRERGGGDYGLTLRMDAKDGSFRPSISFTLARTRSADRLSKLATRSRAQTYTGHPDVASLAKEWLAVCLSEHKDCRSNMKPEWYPRRLLDIRDVKIKLVETRDHHPSQPYATMSHCWGGEKFKVLSRETIEEFRRGRLLPDFPGSFRDIIVTARRLGLYYIWIDCFCIIQDGGSQDQLLDLATMDQVYTNAVINFGATSASKPSEGCFVERPAPEFLYRFFWKPTSWQERDEYFLLDRNVEWDDDELYEETLFKRAWVLQERLLCSRMLHFTQEGVCWECNGNLFANELIPFGSPGGNHGRSHMNPFSLQPPAAIMATMRSHEEKRAEVWFLWQRTLAAYSSMHLSFPQKDKLIAFAGVAKQMAFELDDRQYLAGIFRSGLIPSLCWRRTYISRGRARQWRAPTWSWASVDGKYRFSRPQGTLLAEFLHWNAEYLDPSNTYGAVLSASLTIRGRLVEATYVSEGNTEKLLHITLRSRDWDSWAVFDDSDESKDGLTLLPLVEGVSDIQPPTTKREVVGLVLRANGDKTFQRLGFWECRLSSSAMDGINAMGQQVITLV